MKNIFKSPKQIIELFNNLFEKILNEIEDENKKEVLEKAIINEISSQIIHFKSLKDLLLHYKTSKKKIIENSILYAYPDIDKDYISILRKEFRLLVRNKRIRIDLDLNLPVYNEIIKIMSYAKRVSYLIKQYPINKSTHNGTKSTSTSVKDMILTQLSSLKERLENPYFKIKNEFEIEKTKHQIKVLNKCLEKEYNDLPEILNSFSKIYGFNLKSEKLTEVEKEAFEELTTLFNGSLTTELELLYSFVIFTCDIANIHNEIYFKRQADSIFNIAYTLFRENIEFVNLGKARETFVYNQKKINKPFILKTMIDDIPIFIFKIGKEQINPFGKLYEIGITSMLGIRNDYEIDLPLEHEISEFQQFKNFIKFLKKINLSPRETLFILSIYNYNLNRLRPPFYLSKK